MKKLLLVDGSSFLYRAFHAMPDLRNRQGEPTGAIYGVMNMLRRLRHDYPSDYLLCVFDAKGKTFRDDWYPEYKANRPRMPEDLACQVDILNQAIKASGWPVLAQVGVEADDVIGTLARLATEQKMHCVIATGDKDMAQLVNVNVTLVNTMNNEVLDELGVEQKFGIPPRLIVDYLSLIGDAVDNVPGVAKVGPKTAVKWLQEYGSLESLIAQSDAIKGVVGNNLRAALDWLPQGKRLITIKCDVELPISIEQLVAQSEDVEQLRELYRQCDFKTWLRELGDAPVLELGETADLFTMPVVAAARVEYETILNWAQFDAWLAKLNKANLVSLDTETTGLDMMNDQLLGFSFSVESGLAAYLPLGHNYADCPEQLPFDEVMAKLKPWLESVEHKKVGQNLKYDKHILRNHGVQLAGISEDTMLLSYVLESHKTHNMDDLALRHLNVQTIHYEDVVGKGAKQISFAQIGLKEATQYAAEDADITLRLFQALAPQVQQEAGLNKVYRDIELPAMEVLYIMERQGVLLDVNLLEQQSRELGEKLASLETQAYQLAEQTFNLNSPKQIQEILFGKLALPVKKKTAKGVPSTDESVLQELAEDYPLPKLLLEYRGLAKLKSTYTDKLPQMINSQTGRVHTHYAQAVAVTGRLSSNEPNLQNIPVRTAEGRRIREAFIAPKGYKIVSADYSQIELRIMAHLSQDQGLLTAFAQNLDVHRATAAEIFMTTPEHVSSDQRRYAKAINFGLIYGMSEFGLAKQLGIERNAAKAYIERYFARYPKVADYMARTRELVKQQGYVETVFGRRLWLPEIHSNNGMRRQAAERAAINAPMQGTAADLIKLAMVAVQSWIEREQLATRLIMQVHDELVLEVPENELQQVNEHLPNLMGEVAKLAVPLLVDVGVGDNWDQAH